MAAGHRFFILFYLFILFFYITYKKRQEGGPEKMVSSELFFFPFAGRAHIPLNLYLTLHVAGGNVAWTTLWKFLFFKEKKKKKN